MIKTIGNTPVVCLKRIVPPDAAEVWVKIEGVNPTGSYKDRMAHAMVEGAETEGVIAFQVHRLVSVYYLLESLTST